MEYLGLCVLYKVSPILFLKSNFSKILPYSCSWWVCSAFANFSLPCCWTDMQPFCYLGTRTRNHFVLPKIWFISPNQGSDILFWFFTVPLPLKFRLQMFVKRCFASVFTLATSKCYGMNLSTAFLPISSARTGCSAVHKYKFAWREVHFVCEISLFCKRVIQKHEPVGSGLLWTGNLITAFCRLITDIWLWNLNCFW